MLYVSIYNGIDMRPETTRHGRYTICPGVPDPGDILRREAEGERPLRMTRAPSAQLPVIREGVELGDYGTEAKARRRDSNRGVTGGRPNHGEEREDAQVSDTAAARHHGDASAMCHDERTLVLGTSHKARTLLCLC